MLSICLNNKIKKFKKYVYLSFQFHCEQIIGSDTNAQHTLWGNREFNKRGKDLIDLFNSLGLSSANKGSTPTFINSKGHESIIDLTITNSFGSDLIKKWKVDLSFSNSDHRYITFNIDSKHHNNKKHGLGYIR